MTPQRAGRIASLTEFAKEVQGRSGGKQKTKMRQKPVPRGPYWNT
jgi:hypothetical protein